MRTVHAAMSASLTSRQRSIASSKHSKVENPAYLDPDQRRMFDDGSTVSKLSSVYPDTCYIPHQNRQITRAQAIVEERGKPIPLLHQAILNGRFGEALMHIQNGADVREAGPFGWTPLHTVSLAYARYELFGAQRLLMLETIATQILAKGGRVDARDYFGLTPAMCAEGKTARAVRQATTEFIRASMPAEGDPEGRKQGPSHRFGAW